MIMLRMSPILCLMQAQASTTEGTGPSLRSRIATSTAEVPSEAQANDPPSGRLAFEETLRKLAPRIPFKPEIQEPLKADEKQEIQDFKRELKNQVELIEKDSPLKERLIKEQLILYKKSLSLEADKNRGLRKLAELLFKNEYKQHLKELFENDNLLNDNEHMHRLLIRRGAQWADYVRKTKKRKEYAARMKQRNERRKVMNKCKEFLNEIANDQKYEDKLKNEAKKEAAEEKALYDFKQHSKIKAKVKDSADESVEKEIAEEIAEEIAVKYGLKNVLKW